MNPTHLIARSDAMYCGVAMAVTILELALIATNPHLGEHALEYTLVMQLIFSALLEFYSGAALSACTGIVKTMQVGFILKLSSALTFLAAFYLSYHGFLTTTWCLLILAFCLDASGTGCLKSTYRPAYNKLHLALCGKPANYADIALRFLSLRLLLPLFLLATASFILSFMSPSNAATIIFTIIIFCRSSQIYYACSDFHIIVMPPHTKHPTSTFTTSELYNAFKRNSTAFYGFLTGNIFESIVLMYTIGLLYRHKDFLNLPDVMAWLGSSAIAFMLYITSIIVGGWLLVNLLKNSLPKSIAFIFFSMTLSSSLWLSSDLTGRELFYALTVFSLSGVIIGFVLMRLSTNAILKNSSDLEAVAFFLAAEIVTTFLIVVIAAIGALVLGTDGLIKGLSLGTALFMFVYFYHLYCVKKKLIEF